MLILGTLSENYLAYKKGAKVIHYLAGKLSLCLLYDDGDKFWGYALHTSSKPQIFKEKEISIVDENDPKIVKFNTYFALIADNINVEISIKFPIIKDLFED